MSLFIDSLVAETSSKDGLTANGAVTHTSTLNPVLDMFFLAGASRNLPERQIANLFRDAFLAEPLLAARALFWARDIRGGAGERRFFRIAFRELIALAEGHAQAKAAVQALVFQIPEYGTWKDIWTLFSREEPVEWVTNQKVQTWRGTRRKRIVKQRTRYIQEAVPEWALQPVVDEILKPQPNGLLCKWLPTKGPLFRQLADATGFSQGALRKVIKSNRTVVEQQMSAGDFGAIDYSHVPSVAMKRYLRAFKRQDESRFEAFVAAVNAGEQTMNASAIFPHDVVARIRRNERESFDALKAQWKSLSRPLIGKDRRVIAVSDVSGSMGVEVANSVRAVDVSIAMGLFFAEQIDGPFKDVVITFSGEPKVVRLSGDILSRVSQIRDHNYNTNLLRVFQTILFVAKRSKASETDMPDTVVIISDMEFDSVGGGRTNFEAIQKEYEASGYAMPRIVFWNVCGRIGNAPVQKDQRDVALLSGFSPQIAAGVLEGEFASPTDVMLRVLSKPRYSRIVW